MACQKVASGGVVVSGQIADPVLADGFGRGKKRGDEGWRRKCGENEVKEGGQCFLFARLAAMSACWKTVGD